LEKAVVHVTRRSSAAGAALRKTCLHLLLLALLSSVACQSDPAKGKFNVILISIDTVRAKHLSCYGYHRETSPTVDEFAENALLFSNAYSSAPSTLTSHMSIFTSVSPSIHAMMQNDNFVPLSRKIKTLPEILRDHGYATFGYYDTGGNYTDSLLDPKYGFSRGFDSYKRKTGHIVARAIDLVKEKPFFLFVHYFEAHSSRFGSSDYMYDGPAEFRDRFTQTRFTHDPSDVWSGKEELSDEEVEQMIARYDGGILHVDSQLKDLFDLLKKEGLYDQSLIVVTSDHGESLGHKGKINEHGWLYGVGTHVPLIIKFPRDFQYSGPSQGRVDYLVRSIDIMPTILEALSIDAPQYIEGESLLGVRENRTNFARMRNCYSVRTTDSMLLFYAPPDLAQKHTVEIYDLNSDPLENHNLHEKDDGLLHELVALVEQREAESQLLRQELSDSDQEMKILDQKEIEGLQALGYLQ
jgi:arylsulfatase A-like enzyme